MGSGAAAQIITAANALESFTRGLQTGILRGVSSVITAGNPSPTDTWCIVFISASGTNLASAIQVLYADYITVENPLSWNGEYHIVGAEVIVTSARSITEITLQTIVNVQTEAAF